MCDLLKEDEKSYLISQTAEDVENLCNELHFDDCLTRTIVQSFKNIDISVLMDCIQDLFNDGFNQELAVAKLNEYCADDSGMRILSIFMACVLLVRRRYEQAGIKDEVFLSTFGFIKRFVKKIRVGKYPFVFSEEFWFPRLLSMKIFRLGELEFEFCKRQNLVSVHIPSDAKLSIENLTISFMLANEFIDKYIPELNNCTFYCISWLLDPALDKLLPEKSNIRVFRSMFRVFGIAYSDDYKRWVFGENCKIFGRGENGVNCGKENNVEACGEVRKESGKESGYEGAKDGVKDIVTTETSLQKNIREYVENGGRMAIGYGVLKNVR